MLYYHWTLISIAFFAVCYGQIFEPFLRLGTSATRGPRPQYPDVAPGAYLPKPQRRYESFNKSMYQGYRDSATVRIWVGKDSENPEPQKYVNCYGVFINVTVIACPCSCITELTPTGDLILRRKEDIRVVPMKFEHFNNRLRYPKMTRIPYKLEKHPECKATYKVDIAAIYISEPFYNTRVVWLHTAEYLIFKSNLLEVAAAENMDSGSCSVLVSKDSLYEKIVTEEREKKTDDNTVRQVPSSQEVKVHFRNWYMCAGMACKDEQAETSTEATESTIGPLWPLYTSANKPNHCENQNAGSKFCLTWDDPSSFCAALPGSPVFCSINGVDGFMGFVVSSHYSCNDLNRQTAVMQGFDDGVEFFRDFIGVVGARLYEKGMPIWTRQLRTEYAHSGVVVSGTTAYPRPPEPYDYIKLFEGEQWRAVVNLWYRTQKTVQPGEKEDFAYMCRGVVISKLFISTTCNCLILHLKRKVTPGEPYKFNKDDLREAKQVRAVVAADDFNEFTSVKDKNPGEPRTDGSSLGIHQQCDSNFGYDYGYVIVKTSLLPLAKLAWIPAAKDPDQLGRMIKMMTISDFVEGHCVFLNFKDRPQATVVHFEHWHNCFLGVCGSYNYLQGKTGPHCYNKLPGKRYCMSTAQAAEGRSLCNLTDGSPIFCNSAAHLGYVGHYSQAWPACQSGESGLGIMMPVSEMWKAFEDVPGFQYTGRLASELLGKSMPVARGKAEVTAAASALILALPSLLVLERFVR